MRCASLRAGTTIVTNGASSQAANVASRGTRAHRSRKRQAPHVDGKSKALSKLSSTSQFTLIDGNGRLPPMPWWVRAYLVFGAAQGLGIGLTGLLLPPEMQIPLRISPLNARFVAALYIAGGVGVLWAAFARRRSEARLFVIGFAFATALILVLTLLHWSDFMADQLPHRAIWIFVYVVDPLLAAVIIPAAGLWPPRAGARHRLTSVFVVEGCVLGGLGLLLLLLPDVVAAGWPWTLPPLLGQLYACFFLSFALGAILAARETEPRAILGFGLSSLTLVVLVLIASLLHVDRFKPEPVTWVWFMAWGLGACALLAALISQRASGFPSTARVAVERRKA
jgi:hypothetical protein